MISNFFKIILCIFLFGTLLNTNIASSREIEQNEADTLLLRMQSVLNRGSKPEIEQFFKFYSDSTARFLMKNLLVNKDNTNEVLAEEELNMTWEQYVTYITNILEPNYMYVFKVKLSDFAYDSTSELGNVSFNVQEYGLQRQYTEDGVTQLDDIVTLGATNCNMTIAENATDVYILSMNCISKVLRK